MAHGYYLRVPNPEDPVAVSLDLLRAAVQPIAALTSDEIAFDVEGVHLVLRPMTPKEEMAVQRVLTEVPEGQDAEAEFNVMEYFTQFRVEVLSYAIVEINGIDLRNETTISTGEATPDGKPIRVLKNVALRGIVEKWPRQVVTLAFSKYGDIVRQVTAKVEKFIAKNDTDLDVEIERLEARLKQLRMERASRAAGNPMISKEVLENFIGQGEVYDKLQASSILSGGDPEPSPPASVSEGQTYELEEEVEPIIVLASEPEPNPGPEPNPIPSPPKPPSKPRQSVIPPVMPPPTSEPSTAPPAPSTLDEFMSSFGGSDDELAAEEARLRAARLARQHHAAASRDAATHIGVPTPGDDLRDPLSRAKPVGKIGDLDAYRLPTETLSDRGRSAPAMPTTPVNPPASTGNPNFRPPKR